MGRVKRSIHAMGSHEECISSRDYVRLCDLIYSEAGIHLGSEKRTMLEVRVKRRLRALDLSSYAEYCDYLFGHNGLKEELVPLIDVVTTNKTDFFREPGHFTFLAAKALPEMTARNGNQLLVWSAGCSTGEEPYTLAIVLSEYAQTHPGFRFRILATDISTTVLEKAEFGVYADEVVSPVPPALKRKYFMRSRDRDSNRVRGLRPRAKGRRHFLPQCDHLLRPPHAGANPEQTFSSSGSERIHVRRARRDSARYESSPGAGWSGSL
jgi:chemotaxis protein methyltransferase CheR